MSSCSGTSPGYSKINGTLPFNVQFNNNSALPSSQVICNTNMGLLPNGPVVPTRPIFPSALPPSFRPSSTNLDTNFLNVKKIGCINNLRSSNLIVNNNSANGATQIQFINLPINNDESLQPLVINSKGQVFISSIATISKPMLKNNNQVFVPTTKTFRSDYNQGISRPTSQSRPDYDTDESINFHETRF